MSIVSGVVFSSFFHPCHQHIIGPASQQSVGVSQCDLHLPNLWHANADRMVSISTSTDFLLILMTVSSLQPCIPNWKQKQWNWNFSKMPVLDTLSECQFCETSHHRYLSGKQTKNRHPSQVVLSQGACCPCSCHKCLVRWFPARYWPITGTRD